MAIDRTLPTGPWRFDAGVTAVFDDMLARSIPQYTVMRQAVFDVGRRFVTGAGAVVDLGCSRGEALAPFVADGGAAGYVGVETSAPMLAAAQQRFAVESAAGRVTLLDMDLRLAYPTMPACVTLCVLTLQFTPIEYRPRLAQAMFDHTLPGGALLLVEKVLGATAALDGMLVDVYYAMKRANGYSDEEIDRKRLALEGRLVPVTAAWNEQLLAAAGFRQVECIWRWMNFAAWVAVR